MYNGILNVYKEKGFTSHDVVAKLRGICGQRKIGHTGTLDPEAEGVLPVCLGNATGLCEMLTDHDKEYEAVLRLGVVTDTQDMTGTVLEEHPVTLSEEEACAIVTSFVGEYDQLPPMYSAIKVNGKRLYELAREGKEVVRKERRVFLHAIDILSVDMPDITFRVVCSKGTYIRTLCHDIGQKAGCGGAMLSLKRTRVGRFTKEDAHTLSELEILAKAGQLTDVLLPVDAMFEELAGVHVPEPFIKAVKNGNRFLSSQILERRLFGDKEEVRVYDTEGHFYGIYVYREKEGYFMPRKMFLG